MWNGNSFDYNDSLLPLRNYGSVSGIAAGNGIFGGADGAVCNRNSRNENIVDLWLFPTQSQPVLPVYFVSGFVDHYDRDAGDLLSVCQEALRGARKRAFSVIIEKHHTHFINNISNNNTLLW